MFVHVNLWVKPQIVSYIIILIIILFLQKAGKWE